jgi:uncharacterized linocin/CFP29 family protein
MPNDPQVPWTDEQWARVNQVIQEEASRARVAASFLPLSGPLPPETDFIRAETIIDNTPLSIEDRNTIQLATLQVRVQVRGAQMADPELASILTLFRRAANVIARLEDAVVFRGLEGAAAPFAPPGGIVGAPLVAGNPAPIWEIRGGAAGPGLWRPRADATAATDWQWIPTSPVGEALVSAVSNAIGRLEDRGRLGPFATVFGQGLFLVAQTPNSNSFVLPQDRIIPFLGGGSLLRSSTLDGGTGVVVALGGAPVELVIARDVSLQFLQITNEPRFLFRVREKIALRIKEANAIVRIYVPAPIIAAVAASDDNDSLIITGRNLLGATQVMFRQPIVSDGFTSNSDTQITLPLPPPPPGRPNQTVNVTVTTLGGSGPRQNSQANRFTYNN